MGTLVVLPPRGFLIVAEGSFLDALKVSGNLADSPIQFDIDECTAHPNDGRDEPSIATKSDELFPSEPAASPIVCHRRMELLQTISVGNHPARRAAVLESAPWFCDSGAYLPSLKKALRALPHPHRSIGGGPWITLG